MAKVASSRLRLLTRLAGAESSIVSGAALTEELGMSHQAVYKLVCALWEEGLTIDSQLQKGYALRDLSDTETLSQTYIDFLLRDNPVFHTCLCFSVVTSTQHVVKDLARQGAPEGVVVVCGEQTEGRGRRGRTWSARRDVNLMFSVLLRPKMHPGEVQLLNLAAGMAVRNVLAGEYGIGAELKWPNDVLVSGRKICGILSESSGNTGKVCYVVTGIGINVNCATDDFPNELRESATSLFAETGKKTTRPVLLAKVLNEFAGFIMLLNRQGGAARVLEEYRGTCSTIGRDVRILAGGGEMTGRATGVTEQGALIVVIEGTEKIFAAADVFHLRMK